jgi:hypothetical protein
MQEPGAPEPGAALHGDATARSASGQRRSILDTPVRQPPPEPSCDYDTYAEHPRFGKAPRVTGLHPIEDQDGVRLHWINGPFYGDSTVPEFLRHLPRWYWDDGTRTVPNTAVVADTARQPTATLPVTHYFDLDKLCRDCGRRFVFFALEQKHWYEELELRLEVRAVRCFACRGAARRSKQRHRRYEALLRLPARSADEALEAAECYVDLVEAGVFGQKRLDRVRRHLNTVPAERRAEPRFTAVRERLRGLEA